MKKLYFIIPVYKVEKYLNRCVDSVLAQSYKNVYIVLVDDGSPDTCPEICDKYGEMYSNIHVIHKPNGGLSDARNAALKFISENALPEDYITFLDSDDFVHPQFAEKMISICEENGCHTVQCEYEKGSGDEFTPRRENGTITVTDAENALLGYALKSMSCAKVYKVSCFTDLFFPVGYYNEDEFVTYKALYRSEKIGTTSEALYYYYQHTSETRSIMAEIAKKIKNNPHRYDYIKAYDERIEFFQKLDKPLQVMKAHEKICTDIILRYTEQMNVDKKDRDTDCINGEYMRIYREHYKIMIHRKGMPLKRKLMYIGFNIFPYSSVLMAKIFTLRK